MDIQYLTGRYERGVRRVEEYMTVHQRYVQLDSLDSGLPDTIAHMQRQGGANQFLGKLFVCQWPKTDVGLTQLSV